MTLRKTLEKAEEYNLNRRSSIRSPSQEMTDYIATVKIRIDPQAHIDAKYGEYKKSLGEGKSATEAGLSPPTEAEIKLYVRKVVLDRLSPDIEIKSVTVEGISPEDEQTNKNSNP